MTEEQQNHLNDARTLISAAMSLLARNLTGDHRELPDMIAAILEKAAGDLKRTAESSQRR